MRSDDDFDPEPEIKRLRAELAMWKPLSREEAEQAFQDAEAEPMSEERIQEIVRRALDPAERIPNSEQAQLALRIRMQCAEIAKLRAALLPFAAAAGRPGRLNDCMTDRPLPDDAVLGLGVKVSAWKRAAELMRG